MKTPPKKIPALVNTTIRLPPALLERLREVAAKAGKRPSDMARIVLADGLATR